MTSVEFKDWRTEMELSQRAAAEKLRVTLLTVQQYERGSRYDSGAPVRIPTKIAAECKRLAERRNGTIVERERLKVKNIPSSIEDKIKEELSPYTKLTPGSVLACFAKEEFDSFSEEIDKWLIDYEPPRRCPKYLFRCEEVAGGAVVVLHIFDTDMLLAFASTFCKM